MLVELNKNPGGLNKIEEQIPPIKEHHVYPSNQEEQEFLERDSDPKYEQLIPIQERQILIDEFLPENKDDVGQEEQRILQDLIEGDTVEQREDISGQLQEGKFKEDSRHNEKEFFMFEELTKVNKTRKSFGQSLEDMVEESALDAKITLWRAESKLEEEPNLPTTSLIDESDLQLLTKKVLSQVGREALPLEPPIFHGCRFVLEVSLSSEKKRLSKLIKQYGGQIGYILTSQVRHFLNNFNIPILNFFKGNLLDHKLRKF